MEFYIRTLLPQQVFCALQGAATADKHMKKLLLFLIRVYQLTLSPFFGQHCRFTPSCSHYACEAIERHGIVRCQPFCEGGHDPVP
jgi:putative membrane protein insertion efficiency factor